MIRKILQFIKSRRRKRAEEYEAFETRQLLSRFEVKECNGKIYLTCDHIPFTIINEYAAAREIVRQLNEVRSLAMQYRNDMVQSCSTKRLIELAASD